MDRDNQWENGKVTLTSFASVHSAYAVAMSGSHISQVPGPTKRSSWKEELHQGKFVITNRDGVRNAQTSR